MQLKHKGRVVAVRLNKPEQDTFHKAESLLYTLAELPWQHKDSARAAFESLSTLIENMESDNEPVVE